MKIVIKLSLLGLLSWGMALGRVDSARAAEYPVLEPELEMFAGFRLMSLSDGPLASFGSDSPGASYAGSTNALRSGTRRATEWESEESSVALGGRLELFPLPQRFYVDADVEGDDHWFGELRHSYSDVYQLRVVARRFVHGLDNLALYDLNPATDATEVSRLDLGHDYQLGIDIDQFRLRLKTPNFPFHLYTDAEVIHRDGERQQLFRGYSQASTSPARVSTVLPVDQQTTSATLGVNSHLRWLEADLSHSWQQFDSDVAERYHFLATSVRPEGDYVHNVLPSLKTSKNTLKVHTTQTGQVVMSATLADISRTNESSDRYRIEANRRLGHTDLLWTPLANLSLGTKYRRQASSGSGPGTIESPWNGAALSITPAVESRSETYTAFVRYAPVKAVTLTGQYAIEQKERDQESSLAWHRAEDEEINTLDAGVAWRPGHQVRFRANYRLTDTDVESGAAAEIFNNDPERSHRVTADASYSPQAATMVLVSVLFQDDTADNLSALYHVFGTDDLITVSSAGREARAYDAFWQRYLASITHALTATFSVTGSYVYSSLATDRDFSAVADSTPIVDTGYRNSQAYHSFGLGTTWQATERLSIEPALDYTMATGDHSLTDAGLNQFLPLGDIAMSDTKELGARLGGTYSLSPTVKARVVMRYAKVIDKSFDNPATGEVLGMFFRITKVFR